jgi:hypothetical protein
VRFGFVPPMFPPVVGFGTPEPLAPAPTVEVIVVPVVLENGSVENTMGVVAAMGVPLGVVMAAAAVAAVTAAAALSFRGGGVEVCNIIALLGESWV